jgi:hypothetical protein
MVSDGKFIAIPSSDYDRVASRNVLPERKLQAISMNDSIAAVS